MGARGNPTNSSTLGQRGNAGLREDLRGFLRDRVIGLRSEHEGFYASRDAAEEISFPAAFHGELAEVADASFWYSHRNEVLLAALRRWFPEENAWFDVGGGTGTVAKALAATGYEVVVVEPTLEGTESARTLGLAAVVRASFQQAGFPGGSLPAVGLFDVLEHVADDRDLLTEIGKALAPGGALCLTVPSYRWLWSGYDVEVGHFRRYKLGRLKASLEATGFHVRFGTYFFSPLVVPALFGRTLPFRIWPARSRRQALRTKVHEPLLGLAARAWEGLAAWERKQVSAGRLIPFGTSCLVGATKA